MLITVIFILSALCLGFIAYLTKAIVALRGGRTLKPHRSKEPGFVDLLQYGSVIDDGVILNKNGSLMAAWFYRAGDNQSTTNEYRNQVTDRINQAFADKGNGWMVHVDAIRLDAPAYSTGNNHFPDPVTEAIERERHTLFSKLGNMYEGLFVIVVTWLPPSIVEAKITDLMIDDDSPKPTPKVKVQNTLAYFKDQIDTLERSLRSVFHMERLRSRTESTPYGDVVRDDLLQYLQFCVTGKNHVVNLPKCPAYIDQLVGAEDFWPGLIPKIGNKFIAVVAIEGFPVEAHNGILNSLAELPITYRWNTRFIFMSRHEAHSLMDKYRKKWKQKVVGMFSKLFNTSSGVIDEDALEMTNDAQKAMAGVNKGETASGFMTSTFIVMDESRAAAEAKAKSIQERINNLGFAARIETINAVEAYLGSLPGHGEENVRRPLVNTINLGDLLPTSSVWTGLNYAPCPYYPEASGPLANCVTSGNTPFRLNLHVGDVGHTLIIGPTGTGKSTLVQFIIAQFRRYRGSVTHCFDKGMSAYASCTAGGGNHYEIGNDLSKLAFCPLRHIDSPSDRLWAAEWIETILVLNKMDVKKEHRTEIRRVIELMHKTEAYTVTDFHSNCQNDDIKSIIHDYTVVGGLGKLLDATEDTLIINDKNRWNTYEIEELMNLSDRFCIPVLEYLFRRIEKSLTGSPTIITLAEAWLMFDHPFFVAKIKEWLKVLRKANAMVVLDTQNISDAMKSAIFDVILESTPTKIFLPNVNAASEDGMGIYRRMGLNTQQIRLISQAIPKQHYYFHSPQGNRLIDLALGPVAKAFLAVSDKEAINNIKALQELHGKQWVDVYLAEKNLSLNLYKDAA